MFMGLLPLDYTYAGWMIVSTNPTTPTKGCIRDVILHSMDTDYTLYNMAKIRI